MEQAEVIERLTDGEGFGRRPPERIDTHISVVFLTADRAYKLKREIEVSYLDYSTVEARKRYCEAEIAINRRTAPQIYLDTVPVTQEQDGSLALGGSGEPVEWLVEMARFDTEKTFDKLSEAGELDDATLRTLADEIARFHGNAERVETKDGHSSFAATIETNEGELRSFVGAPFEQAAVDRLTAAQTEELARLTGLLDRRAAEGRVRHCHGDLHLRNICLLEGAPTIFDAIEFSDDFSHIDVLYDLAFLLMDFLHSGQPGYASLTFNRYLLRSADGEGIAAMPLFLSLRATIRAHVTARAAESRPSESDAEETRRTAQSYLDLALSVMERSPPVVIAIGGFSGTGKSTLARAVAPALKPAPGAVMVSSDPIRKRLLGVAPEDRLGKEAYSRTVDVRVFDRVFAEAADALGAGYPVILDMTFRDPELRMHAERIAQEAGVPFRGFWLEGARDTLAERVEKRKHDVSDATVDVLERQIESGAGTVRWTTIDAAQPIERSRDRVLKTLAERR